MATFPRNGRNTGVKFVSMPVKTTIVAPSPLNRTTASSNCAAISSGSVPGRMTSFPPAENVMRSGLSSSARSTWPATIWAMSLPRTARFA